MSNTMQEHRVVKFHEGHKLNGYGFDLGVDRVIRFNKHPDGVYLNNRATYSINKKEYSHSEIRQCALDLEFHSDEQETGMSGWGKWVIVGVILAIVLSITTCSVNVTVNSTTTTATADEMN